MDSEIKAEIAEQVRAQLVGVKQEIVAELAKLRELIAQDVLARLNTNTAPKDFESLKTEIKAELANSMKNQIVVANNNQLEVVKKHTKEIVSVVAQQVQQNVYGQLVNVMNETIVPKMNNMIELVHYSIQDGGEVVDSYRRSFEKTLNDDTLMITDGTNDKRIISPHVRTFYADEDDNSAEEE